MTDMTQDIMVPIYFVTIGLSVDFGRDFNLPLVVFITAASIGFKFIGAYISAIPSGRDRTEWLAIAVSFTPSGINGIVFAGLAIQYHLIGNQDLVAIVISAIVSSIVAGPWLRRVIENSFPKGVERMARLVIKRRRLLNRYEATNRRDALEQISPFVAQMLTDQDNPTKSHEVITAIDKVAMPSVETDTAPNIAFVHFARPDIREPIVIFYYSGKPVQWSSNAAIRLTVVVIVPEKYSNIRFKTRMLASLFHTIKTSKILEDSDSSEAHRGAVEAVIERGIRVADGDEKLEQV
jgi:mannitol/fructose-specific phosphotransferase system IIA component (Ntr-type)